MRLYWKHHGKTSRVSSRCSLWRFRRGGGMRRRQRPMAQERNRGRSYGDAPAHVHRQRIKYLDRVLDERTREDRLEDVPERLQLAGVVCAACPMTNREAILRLSVNTGDGLAIS